MAEVTPIRAQPAPPPPAPAAPPPAPPPPDNSIGFAVSKTALTVSILLSVVLALLLYFAGFFTALALLVVGEGEADRTAAGSTAARQPVIAQPAVVPPALPAVPAAPQPSAAGAPSGAAQPEAGPQVAAQPQSTAQGQAPAQAGASGQTPPPPAAPTTQPVAAPPAPTPQSTNASGAKAAAPSVPKRLPAPVPARIADAANLLRSAEGRVTLAPRPSLPPPSVAIRRAGDAADAVAGSTPPIPAAPPAVIAEAKQLPPTRQNALLTPPPAKPVPPGELNWTLQIGAFRGEDHAKRLVEILTERGYEAYILQTTDNRDRIWHRVRLGDYGSRREAQDAASRFSRKEGREAIVTRRLIDAAQAPQG